MLPTSMPHVAPRKVLDGRVAYAYVADVSVTLFDVPSWSDANVIRLMEETTRLGEGVTAVGALSQFYGAMFNSHQRKLVVSWLEGKGMIPSSRNALLTDSAMMRGALTAFAWITRSETKAFEPGEGAQAAAWITRGLVAKPAEVESALTRCRELLGQPVARVG